jgi:hypothetical protein
MNIENVILNLGFIVCERTTPAITEAEFNIGDAVVKFRNPRGSSPFHFANFDVLISDKFSVKADIWTGNRRHYYDKMIGGSKHNSVSRRIKYENMDLVIAESRSRSEVLYLFKDVSLNTNLPTIDFTSCFLMEYTWNGDIKEFEEEVLIEKIKTNLIFHDYFTNAIITN